MVNGAPLSDLINIGGDDIWGKLFFSRLFLFFYRLDAAKTRRLKRVQKMVNLRRKKRRRRIPKRLLYRAIPNPSPLGMAIPNPIPLGIANKFIYFDSS